MKFFLTTLIFIHGPIHLLGFVKAFNLVQVTQLSHPVSKASGSLWLASAVLFVLAALFLSIQKEWWWVLSTSGILISQYLIFCSWQDARFGTIANVVILVATAIGMGCSNTK